jgi:hypothetical protein
MGCMVDHFHLDKNTFSILFPKRNNMQLFLIVTVYVYM